MARLTRWFATKPVDGIRLEAEQESGLHRSLGARDLVLLGIGAIVGTGIFVLTGRAAAAHAGPAVILSFVLAGAAATFAALCYAEMASMLPIAGSAYTYAYVTMGELVAWVLGWDLILEYLVGAATVSVGWSGYTQTLLAQAFGFELPRSLCRAPIAWTGHHLGRTGSLFDLPAVLITLITTVVLVVGIRESARFNAIAVFVKLAAVVLFLVASVSYVRVENWTPFIPANAGHFGQFGISGIFQGATMVFFAYIGFDAVSTATQETKNPQRDIPIGILGSLLVCTLLYVAVSAVLTGVVSYKELSVPHPIAVGIAVTGKRWLEIAVEVGAIAGLTSVMLVMLMGQPRILMSMARDGLLPPLFGAVHPRFRTPHKTTIVSGFLCAAAGGLLPIEVLGELTSIGTLFAFVVVSLGVMILRLKHPESKRAFAVPGGPFVVPLLGASSAGFLMYAATTETIIRLFGWLAVGLCIYFLYGRRHSRLQQTLRGSADAPSTRAS